MNSTTDDETARLEFFSAIQERLHRKREELDRLHTEQERERREREQLEIGLEKGIAEGMEKGMKKGMKKGLEKGLEKGKIKVAQNLLKTGMDLENIAMLSELPVEKIRELERP